MIYLLCSVSGIQRSVWFREPSWVPETKQVVPETEQMIPETEQNLMFFN